MVPQGLVEFLLWRRNDWPNMEISGESHREKEIKSLFPTGVDERGSEIASRVALVPEPTNRFDRNAVMVVAAGRHVGYLPKEVAGDYQPVLLGLQRQGFQPVTDGRIWAAQRDEFEGFDKRGSAITRRHVVARVTIVLDDWWMLVPANLPPASAYLLLPHGNAIQVQREEEHQEALRPYLRPQGETWVYATLHGVTDQSSRTAKELVEVQIDGNLVGQLTPHMSAEYLPIIHELENRGMLTCVKVIVKGNQIKADVVMHAQKASQIDPNWLAANLPSNSALRFAPPMPSLAPSVFTRTLPVGVGAQEVTPAISPAATPGPTPAQPVQIPPKPSKIVFAAPPSWPAPGDGWEPPIGWVPPVEWPPAPEGWSFWVAR